MASVSFVFELVNPTAADSSGYVIGLGGSQTQTRAATIVDAPSGQAAYTLTSTDTLVPGRYRAQFSFVDSARAQHYFPATGWIWFEVQEFAAPTLFSALSDFCEPVRAIMGDFRHPFKFEDAAITGVVRTVVRCGHLGAMYGNQRGRDEHYAALDAGLGLCAGGVLVGPDAAATAGARGDVGHARAEGASQ